MTTAQQIMTTDLITVNKNTNIYNAVKLMIDHNITGLPVIDDNSNLVGVLSEKDVLKLLYDIQDDPGSVEKFMTHSVKTFNHDQDIAEIAQCFKQNHFRRVPILKQGKLEGLIIRKDLILHILKTKHLH